MEEVINKIIAIINANNPVREIILKGYDIDEDDLYASSSWNAAVAREDLMDQKYDIILDALNDYNKGVDDDARIEYWDCSDESLETTEKLYDYVNETFEVVLA